jgi:hypothetical protein
MKKLFVFIVILCCETLYCQNFVDTTIITQNNPKIRWLKDKQNEFKLFSFNNSDFEINVDPIIIISPKIVDNSNIFHWGNGVNIYGKAFNSINYKLLFYDNHEKWNSPLKFRKFSRETGIHQVVLGDYSELLIDMNYKWGTGSVSVGKGYQSIGSGNDGKLILSNKAPSFPYISFEYKPTDWFYFKYLHGWLNSGLVDSSSLISNGARINRMNKSYDRRSKYIALHYLTIKPLEGLLVTIGESIIYSDALEFLYLLPVNFYRLSDHYQSQGDTGDNAQLFGDLHYNSSSLKFSIYGSLFIDELKLGKLLSGNNTGTKHVGFTFGLSKDNILTSNNEFYIEYTRINPFVYNNFNPAQTYYSSGYQLGHWIGSNADQIHLEYKHTFPYNIKANVWYDYIRKGNKETIEEQYTIPNPPFLYGVISYFTALGIEINYSPVKPISINFSYQHLFKATGRFVSEYGYKEKDYLTLSLSYGLY